MTRRARAGDAFPGGQTLVDESLCERAASAGGAFGSLEPIGRDKACCLDQVGDELGQLVDLAGVKRPLRRAAFGAARFRGRFGRRRGHVVTGVIHMPRTRYRHLAGEP